MGIFCIDMFIGTSPDTIAFCDFDLSRYNPDMYFLELRTTKHQKIKKITSEQKII